MTGGVERERVLLVILRPSLQLHVQSRGEAVGPGIPFPVVEGICGMGVIFHDLLDAREHLHPHLGLIVPSVCRLGPLVVQYTVLLRLQAGVHVHGVHSAESEGHEECIYGHPLPSFK